MNTSWCGCCRAGLVLAGVLLGSVRPARAQRADAKTDSAAWAATSRLRPTAPAAVGAWQRPHGTGGVARVIELDSIALPPIGTFSNLLTSRTPGMLVERPSGVTGAGSRLHIRGISSLVLPGDPLIIVDGVRVNNATTFSTVDVGGQVPSRIDDLDPEEIERVEVLSGPASAALYGGDAADGVILVTTRHGRPGRATWRLHTQFGVLNDVASYPANFNRSGTDPLTGQAVASCSLDLASQGGCVPGALTSWNPLENVSPFHTGTRQRHGLSVSGGIPAVTYYVAGDYEREDGVYANNDREQTHLRANVTGHPSSTVALTLNASHVDGMVRLPLGGNDVLNVIAAGLLGDAADDPVRRGYEEIPATLESAQGPAALFHSMGAPERVRRSTIGVNAKWQALSWLQSVNTLGVDRLHLSSDERRVFPPTLGEQPGDSAVRRVTGSYRTDVLTLQSEWRASYGQAQSLSASSSVGVQYQQQRLKERYDSMATQFVAGGGSVSSGSTGSTQPRAATTGAYVRQSVAWRNRLFLTAGLRRERSYHTVFVPHGRNPALTDVSANVVWALGSEPFFPHADWIDAVHLRAAYGNTGRFFDDVVAFPNFESILPLASSAPAGPPSSGAVPEGTIAERTREVEAGLDATLFHGRLDAALTYYDKRSAHLMDIITIVAAPSSASLTALLPDQSAIHNRGYEMLLHASLLRMHGATADLTVSGATNHNSFDHAQSPSGILVRSAAGYMGHRFSFADANDDGIISRDEVHVDAAVAFLGSAIPTRELSLGPTLGLFGWLRLSALFDYRGGFEQYNANEAERCASSNCRAMYDPSAPLADQAAVIADALSPGSPFQNAGYVQDASFWKLREVALTCSIPRSWARKLAASTMTLTLAGRNLATWTDYRGLDPEIMERPSDPFSRRDLWTQPPVRYLTARLDVSW